MNTNRKPDTKPLQNKAYSLSGKTTEQDIINIVSPNQSTVSPGCADSKCLTVKHITSVMLNSQHPVKVHANLLSNIIQKRDRRKKYCTNRTIRPLAFYYILKSLTTSGIIKEYARHLDDLTKVLNCTVSTFYAHLAECKKMGLVAVNRKSLILAGYARVGECLDSISGDFVTIRYNPGKDKFYQLMEAAYIVTLQRHQEEHFNAKVERSPELQTLFRSTLSMVTGSKSFAKPLHNYQIHTFIHGHQHYFELMAYNPDFQLSARLLRKYFNFKSNKSVAYLKKKLVAKEIITVEKREYTSKVRSRLKHARVTFNNEKKQTTWKLPDAILVGASRLLF